MSEPKAPFTVVYTRASYGYGKVTREDFPTVDIARKRALRYARTYEPVPGYVRADLPARWIGSARDNRHPADVTVVDANGATLTYGQLGIV